MREERLREVPQERFLEENIIKQNTLMNEIH